MAPKQPKEEIKKDMVEVSREDLNSLISRLDNYEKNTALLMKAADKGRLAKAISQDGNILIHTVKVSKWDDTDNYVIGWKLKTNRAENVMGKYTEDQTTDVFFEESETVTVPLLEFYRKTIVKETAEIISKDEKTNLDGTKTELLKLKFPNGKILEINSKFIN